jgi:hypothetical protein
MKWEDKKAACKPGTLIESHPDPRTPGGTVELWQGVDVPFVTRSGRRTIKTNRWVVLERKPDQETKDAGGTFWGEKQEDRARWFMNFLLGND